MTAHLPSLPPHRPTARMPPSSGADAAWLTKLRPHKPRRSGSSSTVDAADKAAPRTAGTAAYVPRHARADFAALPLPTSYRDSVAFRYAGRTAAAAAAADREQQRRPSSAATTTTTSTHPPPSLFDGGSGPCPSSRSSSSSAAAPGAEASRGTEAWGQQTTAAAQQQQQHRHQHHAAARAPVWTKVAAYIRPVRTAVSD